AGSQRMGGEQAHRPLAGPDGLRPLLQPPPLPRPAAAQLLPQLGEAAAAGQAATAGSRVGDAASPESALPSLRAGPNASRANPARASAETAIATTEYELPAGGSSAGA